MTNEIDLLREQLKQIEEKIKQLKRKQKLTEVGAIWLQSTNENGRKKEILSVIRNLNLVFGKGADAKRYVAIPTENKFNPRMPDFRIYEKTL